MGEKEVTHEITEDDKTAGKVSVPVDALDAGKKVTATVENEGGESKPSNEVYVKENPDNNRPGGGSDGSGSSTGGSSSSSGSSHSGGGGHSSSGGGGGGGAVIKPSVNKVHEHKAYVFGYPDGTVKPDGHITRAEVAAMISRIEGFNLSNTNPANFSDTDDQWFNKYVNAMVEKGVMKGYPDGSFKPNQGITRAEFAQVIAGITKATEVKEHPFADAKDSWASAAIAQNHANGYITGYPDGTFRPDALITRAEVMSIVNRVKERAVDAEGLAKVEENLQHFTDLHDNHWAYYDVIEATENHHYNKGKDEKAENWKKIDPVKPY